MTFKGTVNEERGAFKLFTMYSHNLSTTNAPWLTELSCVSVFDCGCRVSGTFPQAGLSLANTFVYQVEPRLVGMTPAVLRWIAGVSSLIVGINNSIQFSH